MRKEDFKDWTSDRLIDEIINLTEKNFNLEWRIKQFEESEGRWKCENKSIQEENKALKQRIKDLEDACDQSYFSDYEPQLAEDDDISLFNYECIKQWTSKSNLKKKIAELQDQHQRDCIKINDLTTTIHVLAGVYSELRKNVGMD